MTKQKDHQSEDDAEIMSVVSSIAIAANKKVPRAWRTPGSKTVTQVYVKSDQHAWLPALQLRVYKLKAVVMVPKFVTEQELITCSGLNRKRFHVEETVDLREYPNQVLPMENVDQEGNFQVYRDMVDLPYMHEAAILYNLKFRHISQQPYTRAGDIVIAVNPYQWYPDLYTETKRTLYSNRFVWDKPQDDPRKFMEPHVYEVSALAYRGLIITGHDQSILVSGESGAGKTETVKICLNHIAIIQQGAGSTTNIRRSAKKTAAVTNPTVKRVVESNPLLEAFGNAKTRRNDNSSRFGKYLQLQFTDTLEPAAAASSANYNKKKTTTTSTKNTEGIVLATTPMIRERLYLVGSKCDVYLLEKSRVVHHDAEERTFHIFYQLLASPDEIKTKFWSRLAGTTNVSFSYIGPTDTDTIEGVADDDQFQRTLKALALVGIEDKKLKMLMRAVCVVMQLGNLSLDKFNNDPDKSTVTSVNELIVLASLMGVGEEDLTLSLTERTFTTSNEVHKVPLNPTLARDARDALAKEIYHKIFLWVANSINQATSIGAGTTTTPAAAEGEQEQQPPSVGIIGLLDIFGFEIFEVNRFEQLCINYANEKLQQKFTEDIFSNVMAEYESEGIPLKDVWFDDNTDVLDLIEGPTGLLALLNEECVRPKGNDFDYVQKILAINAKSPCLLINRMDRVSFGIKHYAGEVLYDADKFVSKNSDILPPDLQACLEKCTNSIINTPRLELDSANSSSAKKNGSTTTAPTRGRRNSLSTIAAATVWTKYRRQLTLLMTSLRQTDSRYIRCIKPNEVKQPILMEHISVVEQLRCAGVVSGIIISRSVFPNRLPNYLVLMRFGLVNKMQPSRSSTASNNNNKKTATTLDSEEQMAAKCKELLQEALQPKETYDDKGRAIPAFIVGKTKTFFRAGALEWLEAYRINNLDKTAIPIQKLIRGFVSRKKVARELERKRLAALEEERRRKKEAERKAREENDINERRARHKLQVEQYEAEIAQLEQQIATVTNNAKERITVARKKIEVGKKENDRLREEYQDRFLTTSKERVVIKARQEAKLREQRKLIDYLKKENKRLNKHLLKCQGLYEDITENTERLDDHLEIFNCSMSEIGSEKIKVEVKEKSLKKTYDEVRARNEELRDKVNKAQERYMDHAEARFALQMRLGHIMKLLKKKCKKRDVMEDVMLIAMETEAEARTILAGLEAGTDNRLVMMSTELERLDELDFSEGSMSL